MTDALLDFIQNTPLPQEEPVEGDYPAPAVACWSCKGKTEGPFGHHYTLVGGFPDPNHHWRGYKCVDESCGEEFVRESKGGNVWFTRKNEAKEAVVVLGVPSCFEGYVYNCQNCGNAEVRCKQTELDGETRARFLSTNCADGTKSYRTFYECNGCKQSMEYEYDYWSPGERRPPLRVAEMKSISVDQLKPDDTVKLKKGNVSLDEGFVFAPYKPVYNTPETLDSSGLPKKFDGKYLSGKRELKEKWTLEPQEDIHAEFNPDDLDLDIENQDE